MAHNGCYNGNGTAASGSNERVRSISGRSLAQMLRHLSFAEKVLLGVKLIDGSVVVKHPTARTVAALVGCSVSSIAAAKLLTPEQLEQVRRGERPIQLPPAKSAMLAAWSPELATAWSRTDELDWIAFAREHASELMAVVEEYTAPPNATEAHI